eukprot:11313893-Ditylum_brightwellii.AAC.1
MSVNQKIFKKNPSTTKNAIQKRSQVEAQASAMPTGVTTENGRKRQKGYTFTVLEGTYHLE